MAKFTEIPTVSTFSRRKIHNNSGKIIKADKMNRPAQDSHSDISGLTMDNRTLDKQIEVVDTTIEARFARIHQNIQPAPIFDMRSRSPSTKITYSKRPTQHVLGTSKTKSAPASDTKVPNTLEAASIDAELVKSVRSIASIGAPVQEPNRTSAGLKATMLDTLEHRDILLGTPPRAVHQGDLSFRPTCRNLKCKIHKHSIKPTAILRSARGRLEIELTAIIEAERRKETQRAWEEERRRLERRKEREERRRWDAQRLWMRLGEQLEGMSLFEEEERKEAAHMITLEPGLEVQEVEVQHLEEVGSG
ncbi:Hypothetical predicted protein [Lecanosticta acicola]|uniref:Uncharacterized protein n=1 Tax=Lecanosticta acicola TaxID=111012 RepID=A0AAI8Z9J7_9PEZI|nr:Hypothetical predicted protein [Lecanosticta acicola]